MKRIIIIFFLPFFLQCSEQKDNNSKSPYSWYQKAKALRSQGRKIVWARNLHTASQAAATAFLIATSYRIPPARVFAKSAAINYAYHKLFN